MEFATRTNFFRRHDDSRSQERNIGRRNRTRSRAFNCGITELSITARLHDAIAAWPEGSSYLGFLFARGDTPGKVEQALREAHEKLSFTITSNLPVEHPATRRMTNQGN